MLEVYSKGVTVSSNTPIPLNSVSISKGCSEKLSGSDTIQFNKRGVYECNVSGVVTAGAVGVISIQLQKDGVLQPQALTEITAADTTTLYPFSFNTFIQVPRSNVESCPCSIPTNVEIVNTGVEATFAILDVTVK